MNKKGITKLLHVWQLHNVIGCGQPTGAVADPEATPAAEADVIVSEAMQTRNRMYMLQFEFAQKLGS